MAQGYTQPPMLEGPDEDGEYLELMEDLDGNCIAGVVFVELLKPITKDGNGVLWCGTEKLSDLYGSYYKSEKFEVGNSFNVLPLYRLKPKNWELLDPIAYEVSPVSWKEFGDLAGGYGSDISRSLLYAKSADKRSLLMIKLASESPITT